MTSFKPGDVVLVSVPFTNQSGAKRRPAVVVSSDAYNQTHLDLVILPLTSQSKAQHSWDFTVSQWQVAGLLKPSVGKPVIASVEKSIVLKKLGQLHADDLIALQTLLQKMLL